MRLLSVILLIFLSSYSLACDCDDQGELSQQDIEQNDYIALVRIKEIIPAKAEDLRTTNKTYYYAIVVEELTHYKGDRVSEIVVAGGNKKFGTWTSCDFGMNEGQEWVIFGNYYKRKPFVGLCGRTVRYKDERGFRDWQFQRGFKELTFLDTFFQKTQEALKLVPGTDTTLYSSGSIERIAPYLQGQLHGTAEYFFPDGSLYGKTNYLNGKLHGKSYWYYDDGAVETEATYLNGVRVDTSIYFIKVGVGYKPMIVQVFDREGNVLLFQHYTGDYQNWYVCNEDSYESSIKKVKHVFYHKNGQIKGISYTLDGKNWGTYREYDTQGRIVKQWEYDDQGRVIK
ncbi:hypothetical protein [Telluribacter humicola]|uniref:hypothetical protein n=1 Tax=Telluribacter humicola TaxID=1720261 RepID=UPI001A957615|nr:hypothetical protein [Telluribacter humicola]